jgi:hypothetical protein
MDAMQSAIESMEARNPSAAQAESRAEQALGNLNQLAMMAMASADEQG